MRIIKNKEIGNTKTIIRIPIISHENLDLSDNLARNLKNKLPLENVTTITIKEVKKEGKLIFIFQDYASG